MRFGWRLRSITEAPCREKALREPDLLYRKVADTLTSRLQLDGVFDPEPVAGASQTLI
jgi:hypothetical protein